MSASELASGADLPLLPVGPGVRGWTLDEVLNPQGETYGLVVIRHTWDWPFKVDREVAAAGHGDHGGWYISPAKIVTCAGEMKPCGTPLFPLMQVTGNPKDAPLAPAEIVTGEAA